MNRYHLAKLVAWAERLHTRKRLQKLVYMLQSAGCPLSAEFTLHHYGPYSSEVAQLSDEMVRSGLLEEQVGQNTIGQEYSYRVPEQTQREMAVFEATAQGAECAEVIARFEVLAIELSKVPLKQLEYASTIVFFRRQGFDWPIAVEKACKFKGTQSVCQAEGLARRVHE